MNFAIMALRILLPGISAILALGVIITTRSEQRTVCHALPEQFLQETEEHDHVALAQVAPSIPLQVKASVTNAL